MDTEVQTQLIEYYENQPEVTSVEAWQDNERWHVLMRNVAEGSVSYLSLIHI